MEKSSKRGSAKVAESKFIEELRKIIDPEVGIDIVKMRVVRNVRVRGRIGYVMLVPTAPFCPMINYFVIEIKKAAKAAGLSDCKIKMHVPRIPKAK